MDSEHVWEIAIGAIAFLAAGGWAQTNWRINQKVNCDVCAEKEKRAVSKFGAVDDRLDTIYSKMAEDSLENRESHAELKRGVSLMVDKHGVLNTTTQVALQELSGCITALAGEIKILRENRS